MKNIFKVYNNEAFVSCVVLSILSIKQRVDITRLFIIVSILLTDKVINDKINILKSESIIEYIKSNPRKFIAFPDMFEELIPIILNSLTVIAEMSCIEVDASEILLVENKLFEIQSERLSQIQLVSEHIIEISKKVTTKEFVNILNVRI